jgi:hypothetical protein
MEKFMNRLVGQKNLLEDEKLNLKIEKFFDNQTFQKMVEATDVFNDLSNISFTNSILQKNNVIMAPPHDANVGHLRSCSNPRRKDRLTQAGEKERVYPISARVELAIP